MGFPVFVILFYVRIPRITPFGSLLPCRLVVFILILVVAFSLRLPASLTSFQPIKLFNIFSRTTRFAHSLFHLNILKSLVFRHG